MRSSADPSRARAVRLFVSRFALAALFALAAASARADGEEEDERLRWVPSFAFSFDMLGHKAEGAIDTSDVIETPVPVCGIDNQDQFGCPNSPLQITTPTSSNDTNIVPMVTGSLELMTPRLVDQFLSPRLFAHGELALSFGFERNVAGERKPGPFFVELNDQGTDAPEQSVGGQGSRAKFQTRPLVFGAGAGAAFTTTFFQRTIRIKPSFEYLYEEVDLIASVRRAVKLQDPTTDLSGFRLITLESDSTETLHGLGGGLEVETDTGRLGPLMLTLFVSGRGYRYTGNLEHTLTDTNERGETATWDIDLDPWAWRVGIGARFRWVPE